MNRPPDDRLFAVTWPASRAGEALCAMAQHAGLPLRSALDILPAGDASVEELGASLDAVAERAGLQVTQLFASLDEIAALLAESGPVLLRLRLGDTARVLAVVGGQRRAVSVLASDLAVSRIPVADVIDAIRAPFESPVVGDIERMLAPVRLGARAERRARRALLDARLKSARFRGCWAVGLPPGAPIRAHVMDTRLVQRIAGLALAQIAQYALFVLSWWLLGRGVLQGTVDRGWILGWLLLLVSLIPLRLLVTWLQGTTAIAAGAWLRRRLLRGVFRIDRQELRRKGAGGWFSAIVESAAIDSLALGGGMAAVFALLELALAAAVLAAGASPLQVPLLTVWTALAVIAAWTYYRRRRVWTTERLGASERLLETMAGHRTQAVQNPRGDRSREDEGLVRYLDAGHSMDSAALTLTAVIPRGWLVVALAVLSLSFTDGATPERLAIALGGILLAHRSLQRLASGLSNLTGAAISVNAVLDLARAAARTEQPPIAEALVTRPAQGAAERSGAMIRDLGFRYRERAEPVLQACNLTIAPGSRVLLEGPSGSGKTTLASMLAGLHAPDSGLVTMNGLDRAALGDRAWRSRVVMAPQPHDNYLVTGTLAFNLLLGRPWPPERGDLVEAEAVCRELGLGELLERLPGGLQQMVGETGWQLSQGERVRVFLARALLQKPELLILDESFSALDAENVDRAIRTVLHRAPTVLAIAHP